MSALPEVIRQNVHRDAREVCGYCRSPQHLTMGKLEIEHIIPRAHGGKDEETNLWLSCSLCNRYKGTQVRAVDPLTNELAPLYNPRTNQWDEHFSWSEDGATIIGSTPSGRATVMALKLNNEIAIEVRRNWIVAGWHPPKNRHSRTESDGNPGK